MAKINPLSGQQRLRQLAKTQLGTVLRTENDDNQAAETDATPFSDKHQQLAARSGAAAGHSGLTLAQRAERRLQMQTERQQINLEKIMLLAQDYCPEHVSAQDVDPDWFQQYCELVLDVSNGNMQQLWAKILAGEIASPGKFSLKTLHTLKRMSYKEALAQGRKPQAQAGNLGMLPVGFFQLMGQFCQHLVGGAAPAECAHCLSPGYSFSSYRNSGSK